MKFTTPTEPLKAALAKLTSPPGEEPAHIGSLAVVITAAGFDGVTLRRTTGASNLKITITGDAETDGECGVDHATLAAALTGFTAKELELEYDGKYLEVRSGKSRARLQTFQPEDLLVPIVLRPTTGTLNIEAAELDAALGCAVAAASTNVAEPQFAGVCLRVQKGFTSFFAVDRRRVHLQWCGERAELFHPAADGAKDDGVMLPTGTVAALRRLFSGAERPVSLDIADGSVTAQSGDISAALPIGHEIPPHLEVFLPWDDTPSNTAKCSRTELHRYVRACVPLGLQETKVLSVCFKPGAITIEGDNGKGALVAHELAAETSVKKGGEVVYRVNGQYMADFIEAAQDEQITIEAHNVKAEMLFIRSAARILALLLVRDGK